MKLTEPQSQDRAGAGRECTRGAPGPIHPPTPRSRWPRAHPVPVPCVALGPLRRKTSLPVERGSLRSPRRPAFPLLGWEAPRMCRPQGDRGERTRLSCLQDDASNIRARNHQPLNFSGTCVLDPCSRASFLNTPWLPPVGQQAPRCLRGFPAHRPLPMAPCCSPVPD